MLPEASKSLPSQSLHPKPSMNSKPESPAGPTPRTYETTVGASATPPGAGLSSSSLTTLTKIRRAQTIWLVHKFTASSRMIVPLRLLSFLLLFLLLKD